MPLLSKVKRRFKLPAGILIALSCTGILGAQTPSDPGSIGERAVKGPRPAVLVPPLLDKASGKSVALKLNLKTQRLHLLIDGEIAIDTPVSTGRKHLATPAGKYEIEKKETSRKQDSYGILLDAGGKLIVPGVYRDRDAIPTRLRFQPVMLQHVLTIKGKQFTIHAGAVGALPTSDGAIIVPPEVAKTLYSKVPVGCPLEIVAE